MVHDFRIGEFILGASAPPFVIAEMSGNHNHSLERALSIVDAAAHAGVQGFKIQTYTADTITLDVDHGDFVIEDPDSLWFGRTLYELYDDAHTPWEWHKAIFDRARECGMVPFSTPFDETAVDFLEDLGADCYKIASFENTHLPLIRKAASTGKPLIMSTGMATADELEEAVQTARDSGCRDIVLLKCTSSYPASPEHSNLATMQDMRERFGCQVGISDHTIGLGVAVAAVALGATVVEKHFTLARADGGVDSAFSAEPAELSELIEETSRAWLSLGHITYGTTADDEASLQFRQSLYVAKDMAAGDTFTRENLRIVRPGRGLAPKYFDQVIGRHVVADVLAGMPVNWDLLDSK